MQIIKLVRGALLAFVSFALVANPIIVSAQTLVPGGGVNKAAGSTQAATASTTASDPGYVMLAELTPPGVEPRAARPSTIGRDTPVLTREQYIRRYPASGEAGWRRTRESNDELCDEAQAMTDEVASLRQAFGESDQDYQSLMEVYNGLPRSMKKHSAVMSIAQAGSTGALCALTAGLYCIAAVASGVGNILGIHGNLKMQLAHIRLSQANIRLTRVNIRSNLLTLRADDLWVRLALPACKVIRGTPDAQ